MAGLKKDENSPLKKRIPIKTTNTSLGRKITKPKHTKTFMKTFLWLMSLLLSITYSQAQQNIQIKYTPNVSSDKIRVLGLAPDFCVSAFRTDNGSENSNNHQLNVDEVVYNYLATTAISIRYKSWVYEAIAISGNNISYQRKQNQDSLNYFGNCENCINLDCITDIVFDFKTIKDCGVIMFSWKTLTNTGSVLRISYENIEILDTVMTTISTSVVFITPLNGIYNYELKTVNSNSVVLGSDTIFCTVLPVELTQFDASYDYNTSILTLFWKTASEHNNYGFEIEQSRDVKTWTTVGFVSGNGTTSIPRRYEFSIKVLESDTMYYRLKQIDYDNGFEYSDVVVVVKSNKEELLRFDILGRKSNSLNGVRFENGIKIFKP